MTTEQKANREATAGTATSQAQKARVQAAIDRLLSRDRNDYGTN